VLQIYQIEASGASKHEDVGSGFEEILEFEKPE